MRRVITLPAARADDVAAALADAFCDYPVMRYVLGGCAGYDERRRTLVGLFVAARAMRNEPLLGVADEDGSLAAAAIMTPPRTPDPPRAFLELREDVWRRLGPESRSRYDAFAAAANSNAMPGVHHHLNMIGVRRAHQGRGLARALLETVHELASAHPGSGGVSLTTEYAGNLALYEHFGYRVHAHARVGDGLESWILFRPRG